MEFRNSFDDPQGQFYILQNRQGDYSLWLQQCDVPHGWTVVCEAQSIDTCQHWLTAHWSALQPGCYARIQKDKS